MTANYARCADYRDAVTKRFHIEGALATVVTFWGRSSISVAGNRQWPRGATPDRQYFFALDREELPFNRAERDWVYRSSAGADNTIAFGSTRNLLTPGTPIFVNFAFPTLDEHAMEAAKVTVGP